MADDAYAQTERQAAELEQPNAASDCINPEWQEFITIASHDLKEPLRGIRAYSEMLRDDYRPVLDEEGRRRLNKMVDLCQRLENLVANLFTYCRLGGMKPDVVDVDLDAVIRETLAMLQPTIEQRNAVVRVHGPLPRVRGDSTLLGLALANLILNGLKFNRSDRPTIEIGAVSGGQPAVYVRDNGIGIAPRHHGAIFAMFRRLHSRQEYEGSGSGLAIVRKIAVSHGGRVWLESQPDEGSTFYLALPPAKRSAAVAPPHWTAAARLREKERH